MEKKPAAPATRLGEEQGSSRARGGGRRSETGRPVWISPDPSPEEIDELKAWFPDAVEFQEEELQAEAEAWDGSAVVARCFGRRVAAEAVAREFRWRAGIKGEIKAYGLEQGYFLIRFSEAREMELVLDRPWIVNGQVIAVERWRPGFLPVEGAITSALLWIRLPRLPMEFWGEAALRRIVGVAGDLVMVDEWTVGKKRVGFARVCARVDLSRPVRPGTKIRGPGGEIWQRFVFENLDGLCLSCGRMHAEGVGCPVSRVVSAAGGDGGSEGVTAGPRLGPWLLALRRWQTGSVGVVKKAGPPTAPVQARTEGEGWLKPAKVVRRRVADHPGPALDGVERRKGGVEALSNPFSVLGKAIAGEEDGHSGPVGSSVARGGLAIGLAKRARTVDLEVGQAPVKTIAKDKASCKPKKGASMAVKSKRRSLDQSEAHPGSVEDVCIPGVFLFSASDKGKKVIDTVQPGVTSSDSGLLADQMVVEQGRGASIPPFTGEEGPTEGALMGQKVLEPPLRGQDIAHEDAVSRVHQALHGTADCSQFSGGGRLGDAGEDVMSGVEGVAKSPQEFSS